MNTLMNTVTDKTSISKYERIYIQIKHKNREKSQ